ncbi:hypothetical protein TNCT_305537 [Trichonephila clavata]|uniref:Uncharacterized protein n=1 Tax=Trichonephila clavata TaxID=2740835 RepID=A0A8X6FFI9_TRICU|nr:hypothetical protein TNCT_305537 [Trichonephila clavata]
MHSSINYDDSDVKEVSSEKKSSDGKKDDSDVKEVSSEKKSSDGKKDENQEQMIYRKIVIIKRDAPAVKKVSSEQKSSDEKKDDSNVLEVSSEQISSNEKKGVSDVLEVSSEQKSSDEKKEVSSEQKSSDEKKDDSDVLEVSSEQKSSDEKKDDSDVLEVSSEQKSSDEKKDENQEEEVYRRIVIYERDDAYLYGTPSESEDDSDVSSEEDESSDEKKDDSDVLEVPSEEKSSDEKNGESDSDTPGYGVIYDIDNWFAGYHSFESDSEDADGLYPYIPKASESYSSDEDGDMQSKDQERPSSHISYWDESSDNEKEDLGKEETAVPKDEHDKAESLPEIHMRYWDESSGNETNPLKNKETSMPEGGNAMDNEPTMLEGMSHVFVNRHFKYEEDDCHTVGSSEKCTSEQENILKEEPKKLAVDVNVADSDIDVDIFNPSVSRKRRDDDGDDDDDSSDSGDSDESSSSSEYYYDSNYRRGDSDASSDLSACGYDSEFRREIWEEEKRICEGNIEDSDECANEPEEIPMKGVFPEEPKKAGDANVAHSDIDADIFNPSGACEHNPYEPKSVGSDEDNTWDFGDSDGLDSPVMILDETVE